MSRMIAWYYRNVRKLYLFKIFILFYVCCINIILFLYVFFKSCFSYMPFYLGFKATILMVSFHFVFFRIIEKFF